jgi:hypothetical protein
MASRVVELWPKLLPLLSFVTVRRSGGQDKRAQNQRSVRDWPAMLATPRGGNCREEWEWNTPAAASEEKQREEKGGALGGGWMGRPVERIRSMWRQVRRS